MNLPQRSAAEVSNPLNTGEKPPGEKGFMDFNEGEEYTGIGRKITELVMKTHNFIVFVDEYGGVQWGYSEVNVGADDYSIVSNRVAELETRSRFLRIDAKCPEGTDMTIHQHALLSARRLIAEGMSRLLDSGSLEAAQGILDTAEKWITQRSLAYSRQWMLVPFSILAGAGLAVFFAWVLSQGMPPNGSPWLWLLGALLGGVGALVSNVIFNRKIPFDATAGRHLHRLEAILRWTVGVVAGLVVQLLIQGDVLLGFLANSNATPESALALSLLAGLSELFFPTLLRQFDQSVDGSATKPTAPVPAPEPTP